MAKIPGSEQTLELLVNCKTYPSVSTKYLETVCTGGIERDGRFVRLYPIPFRFLEDREQYDRWDVIRVRAYKDAKDSRPESWHLVAGTEIQILESVANETRRWEWMRLGVFVSTQDMESRGLTNGLVEVEPVEFYWEPEEKQWSPNQLAVFDQGNLFHGSLKVLAERVPWQFRFRFKEMSTGKELDKKVLAWSYYVGYWKFLQSSSSEQQALQNLKDKVCASVFAPDRCVYAILGTHSRFGSWMVSALYHLPRSIRDAVCKKAGMMF